MADMEKVYNHLIIINLYLPSFLLYTLIHKLAFTEYEFIIFFTFNFL